jgi:hypothetical protein
MKKNEWRSRRVESGGIRDGKSEDICEMVLNNSEAFEHLVEEDRDFICEQCNRSITVV